LKVQSELLSISRASLYYKPKEPTSNEIQIKHRLDELYTDYPFLGSRRIVEILEKEGIVVGRHTVRSYREQMGLVTIYPKPKLSLPGGAGHLLYPYLLRELVIDRPNQVWGVDITYIRMVRGWTYLVAFIAVMWCLGSCPVRWRWVLFSIAAMQHSTKQCQR
jgi:putative transposase